VAHRPETIAGAQRVVGLQQGKVLELAVAGDRVPMRQSMEQ
jgi:ABC-type transport system involved in Fe-S cluster assembly fused permease/ATPase subunit